MMGTPHEVTGPVNLGNPTEFTILELAQKAIALTGSASEITFADRPEDDPGRRRPDITLARSLLDWEPTVPLDQGLHRFRKAGVVRGGSHSRLAPGQAIPRSA